ncbi:peptidase family M1, partial [Oesophagostomum dentatum]
MPNSLQNGEKVGIQSITAKDQLEKVEITVAKTLEKGNDAKLTLVYTGLISTTLGGLYQTKYTDADGTPKVAAVTQMEPTSARQMVPCFDEPEFKASWKVRVIHPKGTNAISNGIEEKVEDQGDWITTDFVETPKMSSYLLALMVSEFEQISNSTDSGVEFRIWSRKEAKNTTQYALYAGVKCLEFYEKLFKIGFPLKKQDMVALPDFSAGAMENWGLITYSEDQGDWITTDFVETPKMSSYLLALMVSEFEQISNSTDSGVEFRIWSRKEAKNTTQYALYAGVKCLEFYEKLFKIGFPLKKQ